MASSYRTLLVVLGIVYAAGVSYALARPSLAFLAKYGPGGGMLVVSAMSSGFMAARAIAAPLSGYLADRRPYLRKLYLRLLLAPITLLLLFMALEPLPLLIAAGMAIWGFIAGFYWPTMQYVVSALGRRAGRSSTYLGIYFSIASLGFATGYQAYGMLGLTEVELVLAATSIYAVATAIAAILLASMPEEAYSIAGSSHSPQRGGRVAAGLREVASALGVFTVWVLAASFATGFARGLTTDFMYVYLYEVHGVSKQELGTVLAAGSLASALASWGSGVLADRLGLGRVLAAILVLEALGLAVLAVRASPLAIALAVVTVFFAARASLPLTRNTLIARNPAYAGTVIGLSNTVSNLGSTVSPIIGGMAYELLEGYTRIPLANIIVANKGAAYLAASLMLIALAAIGPRIWRSSHGNTN